MPIPASPVIATICPCPCAACELFDLRHLSLPPNHGEGIVYLLELGGGLREGLYQSKERDHRLFSLDVEWGKGLPQLFFPHCCLHSPACQHLSGSRLLHAPPDSSPACACPP